MHHFTWLPPPRLFGVCAGEMALVALSGDELGVIFEGLCNTLDPRVVVASCSACKGLRAAAQPLVQQLRANYEEAAALCRKLGKRSCKELREATRVRRIDSCFSAADLTLLGTLGSALPKLKYLRLHDREQAATDGVQRLAEELSDGALPALTELDLSMHVGDAGASSLAAALGQGALPWLKSINLYKAAIGDAGLVVLAPALRRRRALELIGLAGNPFGDEGLAALVPPPPRGSRARTNLTPEGELERLKQLHLQRTQITDAGCAALADALRRDALPAIITIRIDRTAASAEWAAAVRKEARTVPLRSITYWPWS